MKDGILRIIDANANRAREGLRVVEEVARFILDDVNLTTEIHNLRHELTTTIEGVFSVSDLLSNRDSINDVGREISTINLLQHKDYSDILKANIRRTEEALRVLEEFSKLIRPEKSVEFERLRYRTYGSEKKLVTILEGSLL